MKSQTITTKNSAVKIIMATFTLMLSGVAFAQTTVTLEDQCNCEVLQGTDVTTPGAITPAGADLGDLYVNTATGTIYFWDGDSWELTSSTDTDNQQVLDFSYDTATRTLTLELEDGGAPITAVLPAESLTSITLNGNTLEYLDENNNLTSVPLNVGSLSFNPTTRELLYVDETGVPTFINLPAEVITTLVDNGNDTFTYTNEDGVATTFEGTDNQIASEVSFDNTASGLTATDVQAAIDEINAAAGTVALVDNGDGTYDFTDASGNTTTISDTSISTLSAPVNGVYTYTDESGATQTIDTNASSNPYDNTASGLTATDVQAAIDEINAAAGTVALVDNGDGTYDFTD
ncbi:hypothetical protein ACOCEA_10665, partial [Maribacter sp. CXY002]